MPNLTTAVEVAWSSTPLDDPATATWTDISDDVRSVAGMSGRSHEQGRIPAGTATVELLDLNGDYDPANTAGANYPNVKVGRLLRIRVSDYQDRVLTDVPAGYWRCSNSSGAMTDSSGNSRDLAVSGTITRSVAGALDLESDTCFSTAGAGWAQRTYTAALNPAQISVSAWIYPTVLGATRGCCGTVSSNRGWELLTTSGSQWRFDVYTGAGVASISGGVATASTWHHILATSTGSAQRLYVNGELVASGTNTYAAATAGTFYLAASPTTTGMQGRVDEAALFASALPATAARHHYEMGAGLTALFCGTVKDWRQSYGRGLTPAVVTVDCADVTETLERAPSPLDHERLVRRLKPARYFRFAEVSAGKIADDGTSPAKGTVRGSTSLETDSSLGTAAKLLSGGGWPVEIPHTDIGTSDFTLSVWARSDTTDYGAYIYPCYQDSGTYILLQHWLDVVTAGTSSRNVSVRLVRFPASRDWIHYTVVRSSSAGTETVRLYVNGTDCGSTASGATVNVTATSSTIGSIAGSAMHVAHWALWTSALTADQIAMLWQSGLPAWQAQTPQARIATALTLAGWTAATDLGDSTSLCAPSRGGTAQSVCADAAEADEGLFYIDGRGRPTFRGRSSRRRLGSTPDYTFGDSNAAGTTEVPYRDVAINNDDSKLYTTAVVNGRYAEDATAISDFGRRAASGDATRSVLTGRDAQARAEGIVAAHKAMQTRIERIEWALPQTRGGTLALQLELNDWIRVVRRPRSGQTITQDLHVEQRRWQIDVSNGSGNAGIGRVACVLSPTEPGQNSTLTFGTSTYAASDTIAS